jgi:hypothetical protein
VNRVLAFFVGVLVAVIAWGVLRALLRAVDFLASRLPA